MSLNIKNERVHDLAREAARRTGTSQTAAIEQALERLLQDLDEASEQEPLDARLLAIAEDAAARITDQERSLLSTDRLYDANGLPA